MRRLEGSCKPGRNFHRRGRMEVYYGKFREPRANWQRYFDEGYSEQRALEVRTEIGARILLSSLEEEIKTQLQLTKKLNRG